MPRALTRFIERFGDWLIVGLAVWLVVAYFMLPMWWKRREARHPALIHAPTITQTGARIPGDPLNLSLIGHERDVWVAMTAAGWYPADALSIRSSLHIAESTIFHRPYLAAPVSNLFLFGRKRAGRVESLDWKNDFQPRPEGKNGGGDRWKTDQRLAIVTLKSSP